MTQSDRKLISFVIPAFNEEGNVEDCYNSVTTMMEALSDRYDHEFVFTDNHSSDETFQILQKLAERDDRVKVIRFSRNFGHQLSAHAGFANASGDAVVRLDCDLQDPPSLIPELVEKWEQGFRVVYGIRRSRKEGPLINLLRKAFYRIINWMSEDDLPRDVGDFLLLDRKVRDALVETEDYQPYLRGTVAALGFNQTGVPYDRAERVWGESKVPLGDMVRLAIDGVLNHSVMPLRLAVYTGLLVSVVTFAMLIFFLVGKLMFGQDWPRGFATTTVLILMSITLNAFFLGIIGEYLGRIYRQGKHRPMVVIEEELNISRNDDAEKYTASRQR